MHIPFCNVTSPLTEAFSILLFDAPDINKSLLLICQKLVNSGIAIDTKICREMLHRLEKKYAFDLLS